MNTCSHTWSPDLGYTRSVSVRFLLAKRGAVTGSSTLGSSSSSVLSLNHEEQSLWTCSISKTSLNPKGGGISSAISPFSDLSQVTVSSLSGIS